MIDKQKLDKFVNRLCPNCNGYKDNAAEYFWLDKDSDKDDSIELNASDKKLKQDIKRYLTDKGYKVKFAYKENIIEISEYDQYNTHMRFYYLTLEKTH